MVEIIPAINVKTLKEVKERVKLIESLGFSWAQLDIFDGVFTDLTGFNEPKKIKTLKTNLKFEAHLMTWEPEHILRDWLDAGIARIIFHYEATHAREKIIQETKAAGKEVGIALEPITPWQFAEIFFDTIDMIQILGVNPGPYGQTFQGEAVIKKIKTLKEVHPNVIVEVDGGVNDTNTRDLVRAGADILVVGSYLFESPDPIRALNHLKDILSLEG